MWLSVGSVSSAVGWCSTAGENVHRDGTSRLSDFDPVGGQLRDGNAFSSTISKQQSTF